MTEPQVWTLIGIFAGGMLATATLISTLFLRIMQNGLDGIGKEFENVRKEIISVRTQFSSEFESVGKEIASVRTQFSSEFESVGKEIASVRTQFSSEFESVRKEFTSVRTEFSSEFAGMRTEIHAVHGRIDHLDRDVNAIYHHLFGIDRG